jgi:hemerythrin-like domain-containing protein
MEFSRRTAQLLHEDHRATVAMVEALEDLIARSRRGIPDVTEARTREILERTATALEQEIRGHFAFEENELFTRLEEFGDVGIGEHLREEHQAILPLGEEIVASAGAALNDGYTEASWQVFRSRSGELIERMLAHIQKEEMALLPMLDDLLDPETDMQLAEAYSLNH